MSVEDFTVGQLQSLFQNRLTPAALIRARSLIYLLDTNVVSDLMRSDLSYGEKFYSV
jgi:hypothetical protein